MSQPPTRQSRFGSDEDMDFYGRTQDRQLLRGTVASPGYRRRQVKRLMNSQQVNYYFILEYSLLSSPQNDILYPLSQIVLIMECCPQ